MQYEAGDSSEVVGEEVARCGPPHVPTERGPRVLDGVGRPALLGVLGLQVTLASRDVESSAPGNTFISELQYILKGYQRFLIENINELGFKSIKLEMLYENINSVTLKAQEVISVYEHILITV